MSFGDPNNPYNQQPPQGQPGYPQQAPQDVPPQYGYPQQAPQGFRRSTAIPSRRRSRTGRTRPPECPACRERGCRHWPTGGTASARTCSTH